MRAGAIGEIRLVVCGFSYRRDRPGDVRLDPALGGGALWDIGCYPVSMALLLAGAPALVAGLRRLGPTGVDEEFSGTLSFANGGMAQISASFAASYQTYLRMVGTTGTLSVDHPFRPEPIEHLHIVRDDGSETLTVKGNAIFEDEVIDMEDAVLGVRRPRVSLEDSRLHAATLAALHESARSGRRIRLT